MATDPIMKRKGLLAAALIAIVAVAAVLLYVAYQPQGTAPEGQTTVTYTSPLYSATGIPINTKLLVTFNRAMDHSLLKLICYVLGRMSSFPTPSYEDYKLIGSLFQHAYLLSA